MSKLSEGVPDLPGWDTTEEYPNKLVGEYPKVHSSLSLSILSSFASKLIWSIILSISLANSPSPSSLNMIGVEEKQRPVPMPCIVFQGCVFPH